MIMDIHNQEKVFSEWALGEDNKFRTSSQINVSKNLNPAQSGELIKQVIVSPQMSTALNVLELW